VGAAIARLALPPCIRQQNGGSFHWTGLSIWFGPAPLPPPPSYAGVPVDGHLCFALINAFADAMRGPKGADTPISMVFAGRANRIEAGLIARAGDDDAALNSVRESLLAAADKFDTAAFDALEEPEAEAIMNWCEKLAGPDE